MDFDLLGVSRMPFVAVGVFVVCAWALALGLVYVVGAARGGRAALDYFAWSFWVGAVALVGVFVWAALTGQWKEFIATFGFEPMAEMLLFAFLFIFTLAWMGGSYANTKLSEEASSAGKAARDEADEPQSGGKDSEEE